MSDGSADDREPTAAEAEGAYCRAIEAHLCRRNHGHVVRLVGPSFERVRGWAVRGIPLKLAIQGIDRYVDRAEAKGPRRRPIRAEFCEPDVLDVFDEWRRALGISLSIVTAGGGERGHEADGDAGGGSRAHGSLPKHVERAVATLNGIPGRSDVPPPLGAHVIELIEALGALAERCRASRRADRSEIAARLVELDEALIAAARLAVDRAVLAALAEEARTEIEPYRARMAPDAYARAHAAATDRLIRRHFRLPTLMFV